MCKLISNKQGVEREIIEEAVEENEDNDVEELFGEALELFNEKNYSASKDILNSILTIDKKHVNSLALMAKILYEQEQKDISLYFVKKVLAIDRSNEMANEV